MIVRSLAMFVSGVQIYCRHENLIQVVKNLLFMGAKWCCTLAEVALPYAEKFGFGARLQPFV